MVKPPGFAECSGCGKEFGSRSLELHEPQCIQKTWSYDSDFPSDDVPLAIEDEKPPSDIMEDEEEDENERDSGLPNINEAYNSDWEDDSSETTDSDVTEAVEELSVALSSSWPTFKKNSPRRGYHGRAQRSLNSSLRPITATLPRPTVLNIAYINKLDMSLTRSSELGFRSRKLVLPSIRRRQEVSLSRSFPGENRIKDASVGQAPSIRPHTITIKGRTPLVNDIQQIPDAQRTEHKGRTDRSQPCDTCGRSIYPERFHSHPPAGTKPATRPRVKQQKVAVSKPVAIKAIHNSMERRNIRKVKNAMFATAQKKSMKQAKNKARKDDNKKGKNTDQLERGKTAVLKTTVNKASILLAPLRRAVKKNKKNKQENNQAEKIELPPEVGTAVPVIKGKSGPRPVVCYICGREYGTTSFPIHEPKCLEKWYRENETLPQHLKRAAPPQRPATSGEESLTTKQWNQLAWQHAQAQLVPCGNCGRTFFPERLEVHLRGCHPKEENMPPPSASSQKSAMSSQSFGHRRKLIVCYICGREFGSKSISFHEPACLEKWKRENDQLPEHLKRKAPEKPEYVYTSTGKIDYDAMSDVMWQSHLQQLVPCENCGRTFYPDRLIVHQRGCNPPH